jgi:prophage regulatory protein
MSTESILRLPTVRERTGLSRAAIYQRMERGDFPRPVKLGPRAVGWPSSEIDKWITDLIAASKVSVLPPGPGPGAEG